jgi:uncharacterized protein with PQ loop repeat
MGFLDLIFYLPGVIFLFSGLPQTVKMLKTKRADDISEWTYGLTVFAIGIIFIDAMLHGNWSIAWSNGVSFVLTGINFFLILYYQKNNKMKLINSVEGVPSKYADFMFELWSGKGRR